MKRRSLFSRAFALASALSVGFFAGSAIVASAVTTITTNSVSTDSLTVDTNTLFVDAANNRVGIVDAAPAQLLSLGVSGTPLQFEGATDNASETTLAVTDPTADRTITLPDLTGTVALSANHLGFFSATTSAQLAGVLSDETGTGLAVFATSPTISDVALSVADTGTANTLTLVSNSSPVLTAARTLTLDTNDGSRTLDLGGDITTASNVTVSGGALTLTLGGATSLTLPTSGTVTALGNTTTGTGNVVLASSPTLTTPTITGGLGGDLAVNGTLLTLDADNAGAGATVRLLAEQGSDLDGEIRYNTATNQWELSNNGGAFSAIGTGSASGWTDSGTDVTLATATDNVFVGNSSGSLWGGTTPKWQFSGLLGRFAMFDFSNTNAGSILILGKSRSGTVGTYGVPQSDDILGGIYFSGAEAVRFNSGATMEAKATELWVADTARGSKLTFATTANTTIANVERVVIDHNGNVGVGDTSPAALLTVGSGDLFQVSSTGSVTASPTNTTTDAYTLNGASLTDGDLLFLNGGDFTNDTGRALFIDVTESTETADLVLIQSNFGSANNNVFRIEADGEAFSDVGFTAGAFSTKYFDGSIESTGALSINTTSGQPVTIGAGGLTVDGVKAPQYVEVSFNAPLSTSIIDQAFFIASQAYEVVGVRHVHAASAAAAANAQISKDTGTQAPGTGVGILTNNTNTGFNLNAVANTVQTGTLTGTAANLQLAAGDRLSVDFGGTLTGASGIVVTVTLKRL